MYATFTDATLIEIKTIIGTIQIILYYLTRRSVIVVLVAVSMTQWATLPKRKHKALSSLRMLCPTAMATNFSLGPLLHHKGCY